MTDAFRAPRAARSDTGAAREHDERMEPRRILAVDWSGRRAGERRHLWLAEARDGRIVRLEDGKSRAELVAHVIDLAGEDPRLVVGFDFAFAFPAWFTRSLGCANAPELWNLVAAEGDAWLERCHPPFWGRKGTHAPQLVDGCSPWRATEREFSSIRGTAPKSAFQILGAGTVGTGSIRGMPFLSTLRSAGFAVWPFDDASLPLALEIYPRLLTRDVTKNKASARELHLRTHAADEDERFVRAAIDSDDAFDALVSARVMARERASLARLEPARTELERLEGRIWAPASVRVSSSGLLR